MVEYAGEKMSKSLGNLVLVRDALRHHRADAIRLYLHAHHYRTPFPYEDDGPARYEPLVRRIEQALAVDTGRGQPLDLDTLATAFASAIDDDLDTPAAIDVLRTMANAIIAAGEGGQDVQAAQVALRTGCALLGLAACR
jgi:cysteinyl-tRNA synthetase